MVNEPGVVSIDAGAFVTVWPSGGADAVTIDGCVAMPGLGRSPDAGPPDVREIETTYGGGVTMTVGLGSVATPGALAALDLAHARFGQVPWAEVVAPAEAVARGGFVLGVASGYYLPHVRESVFAWDAETSAALRDVDGQWVEAGAHMLFAGLGDTLAMVAAEGARTLYVGALAEVVTADMAARGGLVTARDLAAYRALERPALAVRCGAWELRTNPPPAIGGAVLAALLTLLGDRPRGAWTDEDVALLVDVQRAVLGYRRDHLDVAADREAAGLGLLEHVAGSGGRSPSTVHVSVVDSAGVGVRDHGVQRLRLRGDRARHGHLAEQLPRRARAQPWRAAAARASASRPTWRRRSGGRPTAECWPSAAPAPTASRRLSPRCSPRSPTAARRCERPSARRACT